MFLHRSNFIGGLGKARLKTATCFPCHTGHTKSRHPWSESNCPYSLIFCQLWVLVDQTLRLTIVVTKLLHEQLPVTVFLKCPESRHPYQAFCRPIQVWPKGIECFCVCSNFKLGRCCALCCKFLVVTSADFALSELEGTEYSPDTHPTIAPWALSSVFANAGCFARFDLQLYML